MKKGTFCLDFSKNTMFALISMSYSMKKATFCSDFVKKKKITFFVFIHASDYG